MSYQECTATVWTKWPKRSDKSLYDMDGELILRTKSKKFDLADSVGNRFDGGTLLLRFGIRCRTQTSETWSEDNLRAQESNIRYDLSHDGFNVSIERLKGLKLSCNEEALWQLHIDAA